MLSTTPNPLPTANDPQTYAIIGAGMTVHTELGCGFLEPVYREAFEIELRERNIPYQREVALQIRYRHHVLPVTYRIDFLCFDDVVVELKALSQIGSIEEAQLINYLRAGNKQRGLILNFGARSVQFKRKVLSVCGSVSK